MAIKIMVTGGSGFIGHHLMNALGKKAFNYDSLDPYHDVRNENQLEYLINKQDIKLIVHLAAISSNKEVDKDRAKAFEVNVLGSYKVFKAARDKNIPVIAVSSAAVMEWNKSFYGYTKHCMEELAEFFPNVTILRLYNVYGEGSKSVVNIFIDRVKKGKAITLYGNTTRDYIYIDDVIGLIQKIIENKYRKKLYIGATGKSSSLEDIAFILNSISKAGIEMKRELPLDEIQDSFWDERLSDSKNAISLEEGMKKLIKYI